ncbi:KilA-N domain-containing protein [uncultured Thiodictyon sp.]|uniref:KilA-N domain-containing protein n=1 Tax=uncultured Thiodictyon sp. TaxID=1846217 RepID=UPI0025F3F7E0|nr:KilA-N domain-containing protein [uncultured Thiodictyon sp.]
MSQLPASPSLYLSDTAIREDEDGRFCLNDLHKAAGGEKRHQPSDWQRTEQAKALIAELRKPLNSAAPGIPGAARIKPLEPVAIVMGGNGQQGTYVVRELVYAYAMWISPAFHIQVIRTFDAVTQGQPAPRPAPGPARGLIVDPDQASWSDFLAVWHATWGPRPRRAVDLADGAAVQPRVAAALAALGCPPDRRGAARRLATLLRRHTGETCGDLRLRYVPGTGTHGGKWFVEPARAALPPSAPTKPVDQPAPARDILDDPKVRGAIEQKILELSLASAAHNREVLLDQLRRRADLSDPAAVIAALHPLELDHGKCVMVNIQLLQAIMNRGKGARLMLEQQQACFDQLRAALGWAA